MASNNSSSSGRIDDYYAGISRHINFSVLPNPLDKVELLEIIGEGTYGEVYSARETASGTLPCICSYVTPTGTTAGRSVAVKIMESIADNIEEIDEEFLVYRDLCLHPNIPSFYGLYFNAGKKREEDQLWFVMEV